MHFHLHIRQLPRQEIQIQLKHREQPRHRSMVQMVSHLPFILVNIFNQQIIIIQIKDNIIIKVIILQFQWDYFELPVIVEKNENYETHTNKLRVSNSSSSSSFEFKF